MNKVVKAKVSWVPAEAGGRMSPPPGPRYITVARFEDDKDSYPKEAWSLVLEFSGLPDNSLNVIADVRFLVEDAPVQLLHQGSIFELYEGYRLVARGEVL
ncbi:MAG TPA: hypothetical protein VD835_03585 [Pyrinomonadaceae bacterium]|nr:hypothetical protein [Pyrinomonadaceae bacterium]